MAEPVSLDALKVQLRLDLSYVDEDGHLTNLILAARRTVEKAVNQTIVALPSDDMPIVRQAILMLAAFWYDARDATDAMPASVLTLVSPLRRWG
jgi:hypothetical protein